jgi:hypothetical protein
MRAFVRRAWRELVTAAAILAGWLALTWGLAQLCRPAVVWALSIALLLFSAAGWRLLFTIAVHGLYSLTTEDSPHA